MKFLEHYILNLLKKHFSLIVIVLGAGCLFLSNILTKNIFTPMDYGQYSIVITYFSIMYLFGILGTEQGFIRFSYKKQNGIIETHKSQLILICLLSIISTIFGTTFFKLFYSEIRFNVVLLFFASFSVIFILFLFNTLRLNEDFTLSQIVTNYWKVFLLILSLIYYVNDKSDFESYINILSGIIIIGFIVIIYLMNLKVKFIYSKEKIKLGQTFFNFFISIACFTLISFADRFLIEYKFSIEEFGNYFYLSNLFLAPFSILQNYIGFKQLVLFKNNFTLKYFEKQNRKAVLTGFLLAFVIIPTTYILSYNNWLQFNFDDHKNIIIVLLITGIVRLYSSSVLSAFEAKVSVETLKKSNIIIIFITSLLLTICAITTINIEVILICVAIIWFLRAFIHKHLLLDQIKSIPEK